MPRLGKDEIFTIQPDGTGKRDLYRVRPDGSAIRNITKRPGEEMLHVITS